MNTYYLDATTTNPTQANQASDLTQVSRYMYIPTTYVGTWIRYLPTHATYTYLRYLYLPYLTFYSYS